MAVLSFWPPDVALVPPVTLKQRGQSGLAQLRALKAGQYSIMFTASVPQRLGALVWAEPQRQRWQNADAQTWIQAIACSSGEASASSRLC